MTMGHSEQVVQLAALGRPFQLGMLYDRRRDILIPGVTLWDPAALTKNIDIQPQSNTETQVIAFDTIGNKTNALSVSGSLKASFLGGLVKVDGAAKFLCDTQKTTTQARVTLKYSATTHFKQLTMLQIGQQHIMYPEVFDQGLATHVVIGILYGAHAFFVFDHTVSSSGTVQDFHAKLHAMVTKIPAVSSPNEGGGEVTLDKKEKKLVEEFSCTFYGDFALQSNPTTYEEALKIYSNLPKLLGKEGEKAVPVKVWLYPLSNLDSKAARIIREINSKLVSDTEKVLEKMMEVDMKCNDMLNDRITTTFPEFLRKLLKFKDLCDQYRRGFQKQLAQAFPSIRSGALKEEALVEILSKNEQSPFNALKLKKFLDLKYQEMYFVKFFLDLSKGKVSSQEDLVKRVLDHRIDTVVAFTFTSLEAKEPYMEELNAVLDQVVESKSKLPTEANEKEATPWFEDKDILERSRNAAIVFAGFSCSPPSEKTRFIVTSQMDENNPGAVIFRYQSGCLEGTKLELLPKPSLPLVDGVSHDRFQMTFRPAETTREAISGYYVQYRVLGETEWLFEHVKGKKEKFLVTGLEQKTKYEFRYAVESKLGLSPFSEVSEVVETSLRSSPPGKPTLAFGESCFSFQVQIVWESPSFVSDGVVIKEYKLQYKKRPENEWYTYTTGEKVERLPISRSLAKSIVAAQVTAVYEDGFESEPSEETVQGDF